jgi:hypothetical protein
MVNRLNTALAVALLTVLGTAGAATAAPGVDRHGLAVAQKPLRAEAENPGQNRTASLRAGDFTGDGCQWFHDPWGSSGNQGMARSNCANPNYNWFRTWGQCSASGGVYSRPGPWEREGQTRWSVVTCDWGAKMQAVWIEQKV